MDRLRMMNNLILVGVAFGAFFIARGVIRTLKQVINGLSEGAEQMNGIVGELATLVGGSTQNTTIGSTAGARPSKQHQLSRSDHVFHHVAGAKKKPDV